MLGGSTFLVIVVTPPVYLWYPRWFGTHGGWQEPPAWLSWFYEKLMANFRWVHQPL